MRQDFSADFVPGVGNVVNIKNPINAGSSRTYTAANRTARDAIVFDDLAQTTIPITITDQVYKAVRLPDNFTTFNLVSLEQQVLRPQAESVVDGVTAPLIAKMNAVAIPAVGTVPLLLADGSNALDVLIALRAVLNGKKVPMTDRFFAITPQAEAAFLKLDQLQKVNEAGTDGVLREATLGRLMGFTIVVDPNLTRSVAYHRDAFALITRPSRVPRVPPRPPSSRRTASPCAGCSTTTRCSLRIRASSTCSSAPRPWTRTGPSRSPTRPDRHRKPRGRHAILSAR